MRRSFVLLLAVPLTMLFAEATPSDADVHAVRDVIARYMQARNDKNVEAIRRLFTPDADQVVSTGEWRRGIDDVTRGAAASSQKELGQSSITIQNVRFIDLDVAIVDGRYQTTSLSGAVRNMWTTVVVKRIEGEWRITAIRNMLPAPIGVAH